MKIIGTVLREEIFNYNEYFIISENGTKKEYLLPKTQVFWELKIYNTYEFFIEFTQNSEKEYINVINPDFPIGKELIFDIKGLEIINGKTKFKVELFKNKFCYVNILENQNHNLKSVKCKILKYSRGLPVLKNIEFSNEYFKLDEVYEFEIKEFSKSISKKTGEEIECIVLSHKDLNQNITIKALSWFTKKLWTQNKLNCKVIGYENDFVPKLLINDTRHPYFKIGDIIELEIENFEIKTNSKTNQDFYIINCFDFNNEKHQVPAIPNQERRCKKGDMIKCEIRDITHKLILIQVDIDDPYFYKFEEICNNQDFFKKYFKENSIFSQNDNLEFWYQKLKHQYDSRHGFWVFSYCNKVLPILYNISIKRKDFVTAREINAVLIHFENWILKNGIITAFQNKKLKEVTKKAVKSTLNYSNFKEDVLSFILNNDFDNLIKFIKENKNAYLLYLALDYSPLKLFKPREIILVIKMLITNEENDYYLEKISDLIDKRKLIFINDLNDNYFVLNNLSNNISFENLSLFKEWSFIQFKIYDGINKKDKRKLILSKLLRYSVSNLNSKNHKEDLLKLAYQILNSTEKIIDLNIDNESNIKIENLIENKENDIVVNQKWEKFIEIFKNKSWIKVRVFEKYLNGFKVEYDGLIGFLPINNIVDQKLKYNNFDTLNWELNVNIITIANSVKYYLVKQLNSDDLNYHSLNLNYSGNPTIGEIIQGKIKKIYDYGIFISTKYIDGLIHISELKEDFFDKNIDFKKFKIGEKIYAKILEFDSNNQKLDLSFKQLIGTDYEDYYFKKYLDFDLNVSEEDSKVNENDQILIDFENEKGYILENLAALQDSITEKIEYLKISKSFFSSTSNARSYLHNTYINYFKNLLDFDEVLKNYTIDNYSNFSEKIIINEIGEKTIKIYPESENLLGFLKILKLFNQINNESIFQLFELIKESQNHNKLLKVLFKTTLANNLILSEADKDSTEEIENYSLKNLKLIRSYISNGIFSLNEPEEDISLKETIKKRNFYLKLIEGDENQNLEFKSTLRTPVDIEKSNHIIKSLNTQLKSADENKRKKILEKIELISNPNSSENTLVFEVVKTLCAFANTNGGILIIGVSDDKNIYGLNNDYQSFKNVNGKNRDEFGKFFDSKMNEYFGKSFSSLYLINKEFLDFPQGDILIVEVKKSNEPILILKDEDGKPTKGLLYVRNLSSSAKLEGIDLVNFVKNSSI